MEHSIGGQSLRLDYLLISTIAMAAVFVGGYLTGCILSGADRARIVEANRHEPRIGG